MTTNPIKAFKDRRRISARRKRVHELERDPRIQAAVREALEAEKRNEGVRFEDLKRTRG